jgi:hypothetical protein
MGPWSPPPTEEERQQRFDLAQKIQDKKMEIIEENKQLQLQMEREAEARRKAMSERVRDLRELYDLEAQLRTAQTAEERRDLIDQIRERRLGLAEQQREDALAEKEKALAHQEAVAKRQRDLREIDEMERRLGRRIDVRAPQTPGRRQTPAEQLPENSRLAGILGGLTAERERLLSLQKQSFTTQLPDALYAGTAEAMKYQFEQQRTMDNEQFKKMLAKKVESIDAAIFKIEKTIAERPFAVGAV